MTSGRTLTAPPDRRREPTGRPLPPSRPGSPAGNSWASLRAPGTARSGGTGRPTAADLRGRTAAVSPSRSQAARRDRIRPGSGGPRTAAAGPDRLARRSSAGRPCGRRAPGTPRRPSRSRRRPRAAAARRCCRARCAGRDVPTSTCFTRSRPRASTGWKPYSRVTSSCRCGSSVGEIVGNRESSVAVRNADCWTASSTPHRPPQDAATGPQPAAAFERHKGAHHHLPRAPGQRRVGRLRGQSLDPGRDHLASRVMDGHLVGWRQFGTFGNIVRIRRPSCP